MAEEIFTVMMLLAYSGGLFGFIGNNNSLYIFVQILSILATLITLPLVARDWKKAVFLLINEKLTLLVVGLVVASLLWSYIPIAQSLYRPGGFSGAGVLPFLQVTLFGVYFATRYTLRQQIKLLGWMFGIAVILSLLVGTLLPHYGVMGSMDTIQDVIHAGSWRGIYLHKNILGNTMVFAVLVFLALVGDYRQHRWLLYGLLALSLVLIQLANSITALILLPTLFIALHLYKTLRWSDRVLIPFLLLVIVIGGSIVISILTNVEAILVALGRDATLTGRSFIWSASFDAIQQRPWLGYGYHVFWDAVGDNLISVWSTYGRVKPTHAHHGFIDLWLDLGVIGLSIFVISLLFNFIRGVKLVWLTKAESMLLPVLFLTYWILLNQSESFLIRESFLWLLYVSFSLQLAQDLRILSRQTNPNFQDYPNRAEIEGNLGLIR